MELTNLEGSFLINNYFNVIDSAITTLTYIEWNNLEGKITIQESSSTLRTMQNNKSPGSSGFTQVFFN